MLSAFAGVTYDRKRKRNEGKLLHATRQARRPGKPDLRRLTHVKTQSTHALILEAQRQERKKEMEAKHVGMSRPSHSLVTSQTKQALVQLLPE